MVGETLKLSLVFLRVEILGEDILYILLLDNPSIDRFLFLLLLNHDISSIDLLLLQLVRLHLLGVLDIGVILLVAD